MTTPSIPGRKATTKHPSALPANCKAILGDPAHAYEHSLHGFCIEPSPDGKLIAIGGGNTGRIDLWEVQTRKLIKRLRGHSSCVTSMRFSADCALLVSSADDDKIRIWNPASGKCAIRLSGHRATPWLMDITPGATKILTSAKGEFFLWDLEKGDTPMELDPGDGLVREACLRPDGRIVLAQCGDTLRLIDAETGSVLGQTPSNHFVASPDCKRVAAFVPGTLALVDPMSSRKLLEFEKAPKEISLLRFCERGGFLAALSGQDEILVWDFRSGRLLKSFKCTAGTTAFHFSDDGGRIASGRLKAFLGSNEPVSLRDMETGRLLLEVVHKGLTDFRIGTDCRSLLTTGEDAACRMWEPGRQPATRARPEISRMAFSPDGRICAAGDTKGCIRIIDSASGKSLHEFQGHRDEVKGFAFSRDGRLLASGAEREISIWNASSGERLHGLEGHGTMSTAFLEFTPDSKRLVSSGDYSARLRVWDVARGKLLREINAHEGCVSALRLSGDGRRILSSSSYIDETGPKIWELSTGRLLHELESPCCGQCAADATGDFGIVVSVFDRINFWNGTTGKLLKSLKLQSTAQVAPTRNAIRFFPDGKKCVVMHCDSVRVWDSRSMEPVMEIPWRRSLEACLSISPDGRHFAFMDRACHLIIVNAENGPVAQSFHRDATAVAIDWASHRGAIGHANGTVEFFTLAPKLF